MAALAGGCRHTLPHPLNWGIRYIAVCGTLITSPTPKPDPELWFASEAASLGSRTDDALQRNQSKTSHKMRRWLKLMHRNLLGSSLVRNQYCQAQSWSHDMKSAGANTLEMGLWGMTMMHCCNEATKHRVWVTPLIVGPRFDKFNFIIMQVCLGVRSQGQLALD